MLLSLLTTVWAASLDNLEVAGPWGTPTTTSPAAAWWNPAGLAGAPGWRWMVDAERVSARVEFDREDPYNGGLDIYETHGTIPFLGLASDLGVKGLGVGVALGVPVARGGTEVDAPGSGSYHMRHGATEIPHIMGGLAYQPLPAFALGVSVMLLDSTWEAVTDFQNVTDLDDNISDLGQESGYTDAMIEDPDYKVTVDYPALTDTAVSAGLGVRSQPVEALELGAAWIFGSRLKNTGDATLNFACPPQSDTLGRFGAESYGICDAQIAAHASVAFNVPHRLQLGAAYTFNERFRAELMGGWVGWAAHTGFNISMTDVAELNELTKEETAELIEKDRFWARDNENSVWMGFDGKFMAGERWIVGGRAIFDRHAVPDATLSPNNYDADTVMLTGVASFQIAEPLSIGLHLSRYLSATRTITDSAYLVTLDEANAPADGYFYPQMNGTYASAITRAGLTLQGRFGGERTGGE